MKRHLAPLFTTALLGLAAPAFAATPTFPPAFQGIWVNTPDQCPSAQNGEGDGDWMRIGKTGIQGYEWGCKVKSISNHAKTLHVHLDCSTSEDSYSRQGQYKLSAHTLIIQTVEDNNQTTTSRYIRCR